MSTAKARIISEEGIPYVTRCTYTRRGLGVTDVPERGWSVTHLRSGMRILGRYFPDEATARAVLRACLPLTDWRRTQRQICRARTLKHRVVQATDALLAALAAEAQP
jgi:hypothetical protein